MLRSIRKVGTWTLGQGAACFNRVFIALQKNQAGRFRRRTTYDPPRMSLTELANYHGSDKGDCCTLAHNYTGLYESWLHPLRQAPVRILEIGVDQGSQMGAWWSQSSFLPGHVNSASEKGVAGALLHIWRDYFPNAEIHGIDIVDHSRLTSDRIFVYEADQGDPVQLTNVMQTTGGDYDIIIDDGSHASLHQQVSFCCLFPFLKPGGQYIIEDLAIHPPFERSHREQYPDLLTTDQLCLEFQKSGLLNVCGVDAESRERAQSLIGSCDLHMEVGGGVCRFLRK